MAGLIDFGWDPFFAEKWRQYQGSCEGPADVVPARVVSEQRGLYRVRAEKGELWAEAAGRLRHRAAERADLLAVGDWVAVQPRVQEGRATIHGVLPRRSQLSRKVAGRQTSEQVVAANLDSVFVVSSLNRDLNLRRLERYLALVWESGAIPVILLNKSDLCSDAPAAVRYVERAALGVAVHAVSALTGEGIETLSSYLRRGRSVALVGSSGVGKSTLINRLLGVEFLAVNEIRQSDDRGRHTTASRQLLVLPGGAIVIDTPGMRELQLWGSAVGLEQAFDDIAALAEMCYFRDCQHQTEPRCAVQQALEEGRLERPRLDAHRKLQRELSYLKRKQDVAARLAGQKTIKQAHRQLRRIYREREQHGR